MTEPKGHVIGVLTDAEASQLRMIEGEMMRLSLLYEALAEKRASFQQHIVTSRGEDLDDDFSIDLEKALLVKYDKKDELVEVIPEPVVVNGKQKEMP